MARISAKRHHHWGGQVKPSGFTVNIRNMRCIALERLARTFRMEVEAEQDIEEGEVTIIRVNDDTPIELPPRR